MKFRALTYTTVMTLFVGLGLSGSAHAQTFTSLYSFGNGEYPEAGLVQATNGELYGTASYGGSGGYGTIFAISPSGTLTQLYTFCSQGSCGGHPEAALVQAADGNLYGTTFGGGDFMWCQLGCGTVFKISPSGTLTTLYTFCSPGGCPDGAIPEAGLVQAADGDFYGTTSAFGAAGGKSYGTVFTITASGALTTLHSFDGADGEKPGALLKATDGNFYGTTAGGGAKGDGTVFRISPRGAFETLHSFGGADGNEPSGALIQAADGNFYGTTLFGGANDSCLYGIVPGCGTIFKITPSGTLTTLYSFCSQSLCTDGEEPLAGLVQATDGNLYGTTVEGGQYSCTLGEENFSCGTVFEISLSGTLTTLHSFDGFDGDGPSAPLVQDTDGTFYGTTIRGGTYYYYGGGVGTVFSLDVGLGPFVETNPTSGKVGASVKILGTSLTGATSVTFNGTPATFKVISPSEIGTTVPSGSATGTVQVVTPSGTLTSNLNFQVKP